MLIDTVIDVLARYQLPYGAASLLMDAAAAEIFGAASPAPSAAPPDEDEPEYVPDYYDPEAEYAASVAGYGVPDPLEEYDPPYVYGLR